MAPVSPSAGTGATTTALVFAGLGKGHFPACVTKKGKYMKRIRQFVIAVALLAAPGTALAKDVLICEDMDATGFEWNVIEWKGLLWNGERGSPSKGSETVGGALPHRGRFVVEIVSSSERIIHGMDKDYEQYLC
jgi:hypothetical protein